MQRALLILFEPSDAGAEWVPREPEFAYFLTPDSRERGRRSWASSDVCRMTRRCAPWPGWLARSNPPHRKRWRSFVGFEAVSWGHGHAGSKNVSWQPSTSTGLGILPPRRRISLLR